MPMSALAFDEVDHNWRLGHVTLCMLCAHCPLPYMTGVLRRIRSIDCRSSFGVTRFVFVKSTTGSAWPTLTIMRWRSSRRTLKSKWQACTMNATSKLEAIIWKLMSRPSDLHRIKNRRGSTCQYCSVRWHCDSAHTRNRPRKEARSCKRQGGGICPSFRRAPRSPLPESDTAPVNSGDSGYRQIWPTQFAGFVLQSVIEAKFTEFLTEIFADMGVPKKGKITFDQWALTKSVPNTQFPSAPVATEIR